MEVKMENTFILSLADKQVSLEDVGGKAVSLTRMIDAELPVPGGYCVTTAAYKEFVDHNNLQIGIIAAVEQVDVEVPASLERTAEMIRQLFIHAEIPYKLAEQIKQAYLDLPGDNTAVAVRSSATAEDLPEASFAGQQETYLNISGTDALLDAVRNCWASLWTARAITYRMRQGISPDEVALAVVVQLLIDAQVAGILFTANPLNGQRDQMVVNAAWGLGEAVVGGLVTPDIFVIQKTTGEIISSEIANKVVRTVRVVGGTREEELPADLRKKKSLTDQQVVNLFELGLKIEALYDVPMDVEWALDGNDFFVVQARPITALPEPQLPLPTEWKLPKGAYAAMRNNIIEMMIDPLTPLFKTMGLTAVNASYNRLLSGFLGGKKVMPDNPIIAVNEYAYYNGSVKFGPMLAVVLDSVVIVKRMFTGAVERWTEEGRPTYYAKVNQWKDTNWEKHPAVEILDVVRQLTEAAVDAYGSLVSGVIPAAWMSEAWFTFTYRFIKRTDDLKAPLLLMGFDNIPIKAEKSLYDLARWTDVDDTLKQFLEASTAGEIVKSLWSSITPASVDEGIWQLWKTRFLKYLQDYGHMIYNLDFGTPVPADHPEPVIETFKLFLEAGGVNPYVRQKQSAEQRETAIQKIRSRLSRGKLKRFEKNLARAQRFAPLREDGLAEVGLSYPVIRKALHALAERLVQAGAIEDAEDIYWLEVSELVDVAKGLDAGEDLRSQVTTVSRRKAIWHAARRASPPLMLPQLKVFGVDLVALKTGAGKQKGDTIKGVAASSGEVTAPACVLYGPEDFSKMKSGDVLVASITTPAWTPLFARAAGVVTDIGGPLSHGSIVAREYGIPAVLGTAVATTRIRDGQMVTVDGNTGTVTLL
jgi:phosphohistidine swiveling domain-containing protein